MMRRLRLGARKLRVSLAEACLPADFYVQETPYLCRRSGFLPTLQQCVRAFNARPDKVSRDGVRWLTLKYLLRQVASCDSGHYAELGTYRGKTAREIYAEVPEGSLLYCFDTFAGFSESDTRAEAQYSKVSVVSGTFGDTDLERVRSYIVGGLAPDRLELRPGTFPETFASLESVRWRFVHLDCDLAAPTRHALDLFWPALVPGGVVLIHDFNGHFAEGIRNVTLPFCARVGCVPVPVCDGSGSVILAKPYPRSA